MSGGLPFPFSKPYDAMGQLIQEFLAKQDRISNIILGTDGESISASVYSSLVIDVGLISFQTYGNLDVVEQIIKNTEISNPGLVKEFAKDLGISTDAQTANVEDFAQNLANYVSALIQVIGRNDYNDIPSNSQIFEDEVMKEAQTLGLTVKFAGENTNDAENVLTVPENFACKTVEQFTKSIEGVVKCEVTQFDDLFGIEKNLNKVIDKICLTPSGTSSSFSSGAFSSSTGTPSKAGHTSRSTWYEQFKSIIGIYGSNYIRSCS